MLVTVICLDKPGVFEKRMEIRPQHLKWIEDTAPPATHIGPIQSDDGQSIMGSIWIAEFDDLAAARAYMATDPYAKAGIFEKVIIQPTRNIAKPK